MNAEEQGLVEAVRGLAALGRDITLAGPAGT